MSRVSRDSLDVYLFSLVFPRFPMLSQYLSLCPGPILIYHPPIMQMLTWHPPEYPMLTWLPTVPVTVVLLCAPKICWQTCCSFSAIQIFPQSLISKLQKDSSKNKARLKCGPSSGTLGPIQIIFARVYLLYWAGSVFKSQLPSTKTLWVVAFLRTFFASIL